VDGGQDAMMPYTEWIARGPVVCDAECAEAMGWTRHPDKAIAVWCLNGEATQTIRGWSPTTDRNATAMMLDAVEAAGLQAAMQFSVYFAGLCDYTGHGAILCQLRAPASLLAYCAWRALKEEA
jgi:hypothetical protein